VAGRGPLMACQRELANAASKTGAGTEHAVRRAGPLKRQVSKD
jgi:hypothetical protein